MSTLFTKIIDGEIPGVFVWEDEVCAAFMTIGPITAGHVLVVPRSPVDQLIDLPDGVSSHLMVVASRIGRAQREVFGAPRAGMIVAGFEIPHAHLHVFPIESEADISFARATTATPAELTENAALLRRELTQAGFGQFARGR